MSESFDGRALKHSDEIVELDMQPKGAFSHSLILAVFNGIATIL